MHELGHAIHEILDTAPQQAIGVTLDPKKIPEVYERYVATQEFLGDYSRTNFAEMFAHGGLWYYANRARLQKDAPTLFNLMSQFYGLRMITPNCAGPTNNVPLEGSKIPIIKHRAIGLNIGAGRLYEFADGRKRAYDLVRENKTLAEAGAICAARGGTIVDSSNPEEVNHIAFRVYKMRWFDVPVNKHKKLNDPIWNDIANLQIQFAPQPKAFGQSTASDVPVVHQMRLSLSSKSEVLATLVRTSTNSCARGCEFVCRYEFRG
jgi:hypothetical protein